MMSSVTFSCYVKYANERRYRQFGRTNKDTR